MLLFIRPIRHPGRLWDSAELGKSQSYLSPAAVDGFRRVSPVAVCPSKRRFPGSIVVARLRSRELVFMPQTGPVRAVQSALVVPLNTAP